VSVEVDLMITVSLTGPTGDLHTDLPGWVSTFDASAGRFDHQFRKPLIGVPQMITC
jgi:hypothetical protein